MFWFYLASCLVFDMMGLSFAKKYVLTHHWGFFIATLVAFLLVGFFFLQMMRYEDMGIANTIWAALSLIISVILGFLIFHEKISTLQFAGIFLCLIGIVLIQWPTK